ncbi:SRPBCC family protein [Nocardioidaceae bacterium]|nr:SRPBCC family protein [Nocardioidaceae bacterium]
MSYRLTFARTLAISPEAAFDGVLHGDLLRIFDRRYLVFSHVVAYDTLPGWGHPGGRRQLRTSDGSSFDETLLDVHRPDRIGYTMTSMRGPLRLIASHIEVCWTFEAHRHGSRVAWSWAVTPPNRLSGALESLLRPQWSRYAGRALSRLEVVAPDVPRELR